MKLLISLVCLILVGCVSDKQLGDKEFAASNYKQALEHYDVAIAAGSNDPEVFAQAARASIQMGSFGSAERFFGKAISNGAKTGVVRELARFYIRTSNYGSAIRVYKYLLEVEKDKQPVYNNLGTALLYSGSPFEAESYLLIAQQLDPKDPFPYLNLGLLYDQNLKKWPKAMGFYQCFIELAPEHENTPKVKQRHLEISKKVTRNEVVDCKRPYQEPTKSVSIKELKSRMLEIDLEGKKKVDSDETLPTKQVEIINQKTQLAVVLENPKSEMKSASNHYMNHDFEKANAEFEKLPLKSFDSRTALAFGDSLSRVFRFSEATTWLQLSTKIHETPKAVELLISAFRNLGKNADINFLCEKYEGRPAYTNALNQCPVKKEEEKEKAKPEEKEETPVELKPESDPK